MLRVILVFFLCSVSISVHSMQKDSLLIMFWNLENFFDWTDQGTSESDSEFSSSGKKRWTKSRFYGKCNLIAKTIFWTADRYGKMPDLIGVAEVENRNVLNKLIYSTLLRKSDYDIIHYDSPDPRGIDVAFLYRKASLELLSTSLKRTLYKDKNLSTRDMLHARMRSVGTGDTLDFIVCHHPSKYGGEEMSKGKREAAMNSLRQICDSLGRGSLVVMGDFNDTPDSPHFDIVDNILCNKALPLYQQGRGTIRYKGVWDMIDMFMVDTDLEYDSVMEVLQVPFLMRYENRYPGEKPLRTYSGPRYIGGVSDHCPIILNLTCLF